MMLVIFDCDGTLVDSQNAIVASMSQAFSALDLPPPPRARVLSIVGLSLPEVFDVLAPDQSPANTLATLRSRVRETSTRKSCRAMRAISSSSLCNGLFTMDPSTERASRMNFGEWITLMVS